MSANRAVGIAIAVLVLLVIALSVVMRLSSPPSDSSATTVQKNSTVPTAQPTIHVGVYMSKLTGDQWGYSIQILGELAHGGLDLVPILEAGTETEPPIAKLLGIWFPGIKPLDAANAEALKKLNVIVAPRIWLLPEESRAAIEAAVTNGTGLLARDGIGCMDPGSGPDVSRLSGFTESQFGYNAHPMECEVLGASPLLGTLSGQIGKVVSITPNGTWGVPGATFVPLIRVKNMKAFREFFQGGGDDWVFYPLYVAQLGKGRIVGCQFPAWSPMPKDLMTATDSQFNVRAVKWLAHQLPGDTTTTTTMPATTRASNSAATTTNQSLVHLGS